MTVGFWNFIHFSIDAQIQVGDGTVNWVNADEGLRVIPDQP